MKYKPLTTTMKRHLKLSLTSLSLMVTSIAFNGKLIAQDSVSNMAADSSLTSMAQDTAKAKTSLSLIDSVANNQTLLYIIAVVVFILIIGLTYLSSIRKSKAQNTGIHHHKPSGHHHHHKHRVHRHHH